MIPSPIKQLRLRNTFRHNSYSNDGGGFSDAVFDVVDRELDIAEAVISANLVTFLQLQELSNNAFFKPPARKKTSTPR